MKHYTQLSHKQRYQIHALKKAGYSQTSIADLPEAHKSTISRELRRNCGKMVLLLHFSRTWS
ncbi:MAG: helix-turn-helix domain-containing protein [Deltaproteobacteria bacterium]|nr:helix-turn-helix domain-containing protein [Deltaproteobacteria bacterium]